MWFSDKRKPQEESNLKNFLIRLFLGFFVGLVILFSFKYGLFDRLELLTLDLRFKLRTPHATNENIVIIEVSDDSVEALGRWPWPRKYHAALINILNQFNAKIIGFDIIFSESTDKEDDDIFAKALQDNPNVYLAFSYNKTGEGLDLTSKILPLEEFSKHYANNTSFINIEPDFDGKIRFANLFFKEPGKINYNFSFKIALDFLSADFNKINFRDYFIDVPLENSQFLKIPIEKDARFLINWPGRWTKTFKHYSFFDILQSYEAIKNNQVPFIDLNELSGKICLVGVTATGLGDVKSIPIEPLYPGVGVHASIINSILNNDFIEKAPDFFTILIVIIIALGLPFLISRIKVFRGFLITLLFIVGWLDLSFVAFNKNIWINFIYPAFAVLGVYVVVTIYNEITLSKEKIRLFKASTIDGLTGLYNKTYFNFLLQTEFSIIRFFNRNSGKLAVIMADLDHFKSINDTFGHQAGDFILKSVASIFKENCRPQDAVGRFGGEEIIVMLKNTDLGTAYQVAQRIRKAIESFEFKDSSNTYHITMSFGISVYHSQDTMDSLVKRADEALYQAKKEGRNRVCQEIP